MEENKQIKFKDLTRDFLEEFISKMEPEDKKQLKEFIEDNPKQSSSALFTMVKSYIYNRYFRTVSTLNKNKKGTFADTLEFLLQDDDDDKNES